ncbi:unnamed protein product, partial [marine sediment metagenome]
KNLKLYLNKKAVNIDPKNKTILFETDGEPVLYDKLILALGST